MIILVAIFIARLLVNRTLLSAKNLNDKLQHSELDTAIIEFAHEFSEDEIGSLTNELSLALIQVQDAAQQEFEFNRGVSHELHSPIQVGQSATELLEANLEDKMMVIQKSLLHALSAPF